MTDPREQAVEMLNDVLQRKLHSLAAYLAEASPFATADDRPILDEIASLAATGRRQAEEAARRILRLEGVPHGGSYAPSVVESNYLSVRYLLGQVLNGVKKDIAALECYRQRCEIPAVADFLFRIVQEDTAHQNRLEALQEAFSIGCPQPTNS